MKRAFRPRSRGDRREVVLHGHGNLEGVRCRPCTCARPPSRGRSSRRRAPAPPIARAEDPDRFPYVVKRMDLERSEPNLARLRARDPARHDDVAGNRVAAAPRGYACGKRSWPFEPASISEPGCRQSSCTKGWRGGWPPRLEHVGLRTSRASRRGDRSGSSSKWTVVVDGKQAKASALRPRRRRRAGARRDARGSASRTRGS